MLKNNMKSHTYRHGMGGIAYERPRSGGWYLRDKVVHDERLQHPLRTLISKNLPKVFMYFFDLLGCKCELVVSEADSVQSHRPSKAAAILSCGEIGSELFQAYEETEAICIGHPH